MKVALRAGLIMAPLSGAIALMATLDVMIAALATVSGGLVSGAFFGVADWLGRRSRRTP